jgi:hypothetical protein
MLASDHEVLTSSEAAAAFGLVVDSVLRRARQGSLAGHKFGVHWRFLRSSVLPDAPPPRIDPDEPPLEGRAAAAFLRIPAKTIADLARRGLVPAERGPRYHQWLYRRADLIALLEGAGAPPERRRRLEQWRQRRHAISEESKRQAQLRAKVLASEQEVLIPAEAAAVLGRSVPSVMERARKGRLVAHRFGRDWRFLRSSVLPDVPPPRIDPDEPPLDRTAAAAFLRISPARLANLARLDLVPAERGGPRMKWLFRRADLVALMEGAGAPPERRRRLEQWREVQRQGGPELARQARIRARVLASEHDVLTPPDVAAAVERSVASVLSWARGGRLVGHRFGKHWRFLRSALVPDAPPPRIDPDEPPLDIRAAAAFLRLPVATLGDLTRSGRVPAERGPRYNKWLYRRAELVALMEGGSEASERRGRLGQAAQEVRERAARAEAMGPVEGAPPARRRGFRL